ncbi:SAGA complex component (Sgf29), putative [Talaromyces stipitatus ATCC 10500]|uniref:SAGA complex component (Sgf29), putative n=1 Tax=Talaromyces stipitatus (strain ATCC 10500 / CBS 375.48 / QM 6759 / NRRL 1006) TaxID=441959 RepID=B8M262_TALSN|nr:SAGA complex component (Sgf29), putative [Talaromyces stipitatus ATCC 10500]EED21526.1 SAGA complex component (Sgf29), putative [Talaromyces stipitatus ATCC 10500]
MQLRSGAQLGGEQFDEELPATTATSAISKAEESDKHGSKAEEETEHASTHAQGVPDYVTVGVGEANKKKKRKAKKAKKNKQEAKVELENNNAPQPSALVPVPTNHQGYNLRKSTSKVDLDAVSKLETSQCDEESKDKDSKTSINQTKAAQVPNMSRNRPRGPPTNRDNGIAANEEIDMWNKIIQDIRKAKEKNDKQKVIAEQIAALNEKIAREGNKPLLAEINQLDSWYRQVLKLSEEEKAILLEEPSDVIKNLGLLTALRSASEAETTISRAASLPKSSKQSIARDGTASHASNSALLSDKLSRVKGSAQRSSSVSSSGHAKDGRDSVSVKLEEGVEAAKGAVAERSGQFFIGAEVVFKHSKNRQGVEGEGIQCIIKGISGEGYKKRYDVQDPEPNENGEQGAVYKTTAASLIPIPQIGSALPSFPVGKQVLARYPDTTTFYRAEVMGSKKDVYRLKFEGEEDDKEMEVDRRFVLDIPSK